jgi:hypothetical protein
VRSGSGIIQTFSMAGRELKELASLKSASALRFMLQLPASPFLVLWIRHLHPVSRILVYSHPGSGIRLPGPTRTKKSGKNFCFYLFL